MVGQNFKMITRKLEMMMMKNELDIHDDHITSEQLQELFDTITLKYDKFVGFPG